MKKYEDNNFSANSSPSFKKPKVLMLKQELMRKCGEMATNVNKNTNSAKAVTEMSVASSKDSFRTAFEDNFAEALMEDDVFMNEENLLKLENEIRKYESSVKVQNSEISDIIGETEEIEPAPKKVKRTTTLKVNDLMHQDQSEDNLLYKKSDLNVSNKLSDALKGTEIENLSELSEREINLHEEKKINILSNVKIKSQDRKEDEDVEEEDLFSDEDIVETTPQKKVDSFAER